jgi:hypothetical protein
VAEEDGHLDGLAEQVCRVVVVFVVEKEWHHAVAEEAVCQMGDTIWVPSKGHFG